MGTQTRTNSRNPVWVEQFPLVRPAALNPARSAGSSRKLVGAAQNFPEGAGDEASPMSMLCGRH